ELLRKEGIFGGSSTGTLVAGALRYCREQSRPKRVVSFVPDTGNKYLSKMYNDFWMTEQGFMHRQPQGDLSDLISHRYEAGEVIKIGRASCRERVLSSVGEVGGGEENR